MRNKIKIRGMHCKSCARMIEQELADLRGIRSANVNFASSLCDVDFDETVLSVNNIKEQIKKLGYYTD